MPFSVKGMGGLGDAIHQRALIRRWLDLGFGPIELATSHPEIYWDFRQSRQVHCIPLNCPLRTQAKNERRAEFDAGLPNHIPTRTIWYTPDRIKREGSLLKAMAGYSDCEGANDISLPIHPDWSVASDRAISRSDKPLLIVRPAVLRREWNGPARNPDPEVLRALVDAVRDRFYVISIADLVHQTEWIDGISPSADATFHAGELHFTTISALMARAGSVVVSPPGFGMAMGRAVGAWTCGVFGSFELPEWWNFGTPKPDQLMTVGPIRTIPDEELWRKELDCDKRVDIPSAVGRFKLFCATASLQFGKPTADDSLAEIIAKRAD